MRRAWFLLLLFAMTVATAHAAPPAAQTRPWRIAVAGGYSTGYLGLLALHGLPRVRIDDLEMADPSRLRDFDVVIAGWRGSGSVQAVQALERFAYEGGIAMTESFPMPSEQVLPGLRLGPAPGPNLRFVPSASPMSKGLPELGVIAAYGVQAGAIVPPPNSPAIVIARFTDEDAPQKFQGRFNVGGQGAPAIVAVPYGKGWVVYSGTSIAFNTSLRGRYFEPFLCNMLETLSQGQLRDRFYPGNLERSELVTLKPEAGPVPPDPYPASRPQSAPAGFDTLEEPANLQDFVLSGKLAANADARVLVGYWGPGETDEVAFASGKLTVSRSRAGKSAAQAVARKAEAAEVVISRRQGLLTVAQGGQILYTGCPGAVRQGALAQKGLTDVSYQPLSDISFEDDFMRESGFTGEWQALSGTWQVVTSEGKPEMGANPFDYQVTAPAEAMSLTGHWFWSDYAASVAVKADSGEVGLLANYRAATDCLLLRLKMSPTDPTQSVLQFERRLPSGPKTIAEAKVKASLLDWHRLEVRTSRGRLQGLLDGDVVLQAVGTAADCGQIGLYCKQGAAHFDDVQVLPWVATAPRPAPQASDLIVASGQWQPRGEALLGSDLNGARALAPWEPLRDCEASVRVRVGNAEAGGLLVRANDRGFVLLTLVRKDGQLRVRAYRQGTPGVLLAEKPVPGSPGDWHVLSARTYGYHLLGSLDGKPVLDLLDIGSSAGVVGLYARGKQAAQFQDFRAWQIRSPGRVVDELTPAFAGIIDRHTWAGRSSAWSPDPTNLNTFWHQGYFPDEVRVEAGIHPTGQPETTVTVALSPRLQAAQGYTLKARHAWSSDRVDLTLERAGKKVSQGTATVTPGQAWPLALERSTGCLLAEVGGHAVLTYRDAQPLPHTEALGLDAGGQMLYPEDVAVTSPLAHDYTFEAAPTEWTVESGTWKVSSRWSCTPGWSWFAGYNDSGSALIATRKAYEGDQEITGYVAAKMMPTGGGRYSETLTDIHFGLCADNTSAASGYHFVVGGDGNSWTGLQRNGKLVATSPYRIPQTGIHNDWTRLTIRKHGAKLELWVWDTRILQWEDPQPLTGGRVTIGVQRNGILVPRVTIFGRQAG